MTTKDTAKEIAEIAADGVADGLHIVGEETLAIEEATRAIDRVGLGYFALGLAAGVAAGAFSGFVVAYRKAETKYSEIAAEEIAEMRQHYSAKATALDSEAGKKDLEDIVRERGYSPEISAEPPMAVSPPIAVTEAAEESDEVVDPEPPVPQEVRNVFEENQVKDEWDYHQERAGRSPMKPYVIHLDERDDNDAYDEVTWTYYEDDDVLCNELDEVISEADRERIVGETNLEKFGHGSGDAQIVYVRNDNLEMDIEVIKSPNSYAEEVHGLSHSSSPRRRERMRFDDE